MLVNGKMKTIFRFELGGWNCFAASKWWEIDDV